MTVGLAPGDHRFNDAWRSASWWTVPGYFLVLPVVILTLMAVVARMERRRGRQWRWIIVLCSIVLLLGAVSWLVGLGGLAVTIWNE